MARIYYFKSEILGFLFKQYINNSLVYQQVQHIGQEQLLVYYIGQEQLTTLTITESGILH